MTTFLAEMLGLSLISRMSWVKYQTRFLSTASVSVLEHSEYADMKKQLQLAKSSASGPLDVVSLVAGAWTERKKMYHGGSFLKLADDNMDIQNPEAQNRELSGF